ncbi:MAG: hypothetical protein IRZ28_06840 [Steroidobacteraceae bacterium]|nr:hypothetical protein [Steroidobacteraceae bacterium]
MIASRRNKLLPRVSAGALALLAPVLAMAQADAVARAPAHWMMLAAVIPAMLFVLGVIAVSFHFAHRQERERLLTIQRLVEKGLPVPHELSGRRLPPTAQRRNDLHHAITLLCLGLGLGLALWLVTGHWRLAAWALIFLFLSAGKFVTWYIDGRSGSASDDTPGT